MLGFNYIKFDSMDYVIHYRNGKIMKEGRGLSFFYFKPNSSIVSIPLKSNDLKFIYTEGTKDFQAIIIQGQITFKVVHPAKLAELLDFTVNDKKAYLTNNKEVLEQRIINEAQAVATSYAQSLLLKDSVTKNLEFEKRITDGLKTSKTIEQLGLEIISVNVLAVSPSPEMAKALEAATREALKQEADLAVYGRRNFAIEQERKIKESELATEIAVEEKNKEIIEKKMETNVVKLNNESQLREMRLKSDVLLEEQKQKLIDIKIENERKEADSKSYMINSMLSPYKEVDWRTLMALNTNSSDAGNNIALAFRMLAENASKIGNLNITPDLLEKLIEKEK